MPPSAQALYFHLGINADDDGVVEAYQVIKLTDSKPGDLEVLVKKEFVYILNGDLVVVILDWREHNLIRPDRKIDSIYKDLLEEKLPSISLIEAQPRADTGKPSGGRSVDTQMSAQVRLGEVRIDNTGEVETSQGDFFRSQGLSLLSVDAGDGSERTGWALNGKLLSKARLAEYTRKWKRLSGEVAPAKSRSEVEQVISLFKGFNDAYSTWYTGNKTERQACESLLEVRNVSEIKYLVEKAKRVYGNKFAPKVNSPWSLLRKMKDLEEYEATSTSEPVTPASIAHLMPL